MTREEAYIIAQEMDGEKREEFKAFLLSLLESADTAPPQAYDPPGSV